MILVRLFLHAATRIQCSQINKQLNKAQILRGNKEAELSTVALKDKEKRKKAKEWQERKNDGTKR